MVKLEPDVLNQVLKPGRYTGNEWNSVQKDIAQVAVSVALALPDVYEVGMSNLGLKILYEILNTRCNVAAERVYAPWVDLEEGMRKNSICLHTLESFRPVNQFDVFGFSLQYELSYTNVLNMLDLAKIPLLSVDRTEDDCFVVGGGPCTFNPEPVADFFDFFIIGEGEEVLDEAVQALANWKNHGKQGGRKGFLQSVCKIPGIYVPSLYDVVYSEDGTIDEIVPNYAAAPQQLVKRLVKDLNTVPFLVKPVVPFLDIVHDRIMLELFRGCTRGCRFCQAGIIYRPVRERRPEQLLKQAEQLIANTGYHEISLTSLSSADYSCLHEVVQTFIEKFKQQGVSVSLPSLRIDSFSVELANQVQQVRKSGLTFAPEAGTQRLRDVINKGVTEQDLENAVGAAFRAGWSSVKLYFMIGLPTETDEDVLGIADLAYKVLDLYKNIKGRRGAKVTVSVSSFVPKPHTPFQWVGQDSIAEIERKQKLLRAQLRDKSITFQYHDARTSRLEAVFSRGDRRLSAVILAAWRNGAKFDGWSEHFKYDTWNEAFLENNIDPEFYAGRIRSVGESLPWKHITSGVEADFLAKEFQSAIEGEKTLDCRRQQCGSCGVCPNLDVEICDWGKSGNGEN